MDWSKSSPLIKEFSSVNLGMHHSSARDVEENILSPAETEKQTIENILKQEKTAARVIYQLKNHHSLQVSNIPLVKDVLGLVATLGKVYDENLSR